MPERVRTHKVIRLVGVNGTPTFENGVIIPPRAGQVIRLKDYWVSVNTSNLTSLTLDTLIVLTTGEILFAAGTPPGAFEVDLNALAVMRDDSVIDNFQMQERHPAGNTIVYMDRHLKAPREVDLLVPQINFGVVSEATGGGHTIRASIHVEYWWEAADAKKLLATYAIWGLDAGDFVNVV